MSRRAGGWTAMSRRAGGWTAMSRRAGGWTAMSRRAGADSQNGNMDGSPFHRRCPQPGINDAWKPSERSCIRFCQLYRFGITAFTKK
ncbi:MAG: hypothetical protein GY862_00780 [Gammaproteobacteria bacterium]|nr:hypothetical protein [Gammaproteobacteria bacterium]